MVVFTWIAALPLTLALAFLHRRTRALAYGLGAVLAPITVFGALVGGLFGPIGIVAYPLVFSAPAWIALGITALIQRGRPNARPAESGLALSIRLRAGSGPPRDERALKARLLLVVRGDSLKSVPDL